MSIKKTVKFFFLIFQVANICVFYFVNINFKFRLINNFFTEYIIRKENIRVWYLFNYLVTFFKTVL